MSENKIVNTLKEFTKADTEYYLFKVSSTEKSGVAMGADCKGVVTVVESPLDPEEAMVMVMGGFFDYIKTSPVKEILKQSENRLEFLTESGSIYQLNK